jgi:CHASE3 domain sensor protein
MRTSVATKLGTVFGLSLMILVIIGSIAFYDTKRLVAVTAARAQASQFLWDLDQLVANLRGAENQQRGYLLTGEPAYRTAYQRSTATFGKAIADLKRRDPSLRGRLEALDPLVAVVIRELDRGIEVRNKSGVEGAIADIRGGRGDGGDPHRGERP